MRDIINKTIVLVIILTMLFSKHCFCKTHGINAPFSTADLIRINAYSMIGKLDFESEWGIFHKVTGDFEVATLIGITDIDNPDIKLCTFIYNEDNYKQNVDISIIDSRVEN